MDQKIIFVAGMSRSGSTLISEYLGSFPNSLAVGEFYLSWRAAINDERCSCGFEPNRCPVWGPALSMSNQIEDSVIMDQLSRTLIRERNTLKYLRLTRKREAEWPTVVKSYVNVLRKMTSSMFDSTKCSTIVVSDKHPVSLILFQLAFASKNVATVHVVRDPVGVATSTLAHLHLGDDFTRMPPNIAMPTSTAIEWSSLNLGAYIVGRHCNSYQRIKFGDVLANGKTILPNVARFAGLTGEAPTWQESSVQFRNQHILVGNPNRFNDRLRHVDAQLKIRELNRVDELKVKFLTFPTYLTLNFLPETSRNNR